MYHREFVKSQRVDLRLASSFHVMHAMACQIAPAPKSSGIEEFVAEAFKLQCMQTRTGAWRLACALSSSLDFLLSSCYVLAVFLLTFCLLFSCFVFLYIYIYLLNNSF